MVNFDTLVIFELKILPEAQKKKDLRHDAISNRYGRLTYIPTMRRFNDFFC